MGPRTTMPFSASSASISTLTPGSGVPASSPRVAVDSKCQANDARSSLANRRVAAPSRGRTFPAATRFESSGHATRNAAYSPAKRLAQLDAGALCDEAKWRVEKRRRAAPPRRTARGAQAKADGAANHDGGAHARKRAAVGVEQERQLAGRADNERRPRVGLQRQAQLGERLRERVRRRRRRRVGGDVCGANNGRTPTQMAEQPATAGNESANTAACARNAARWRRSSTTRAQPTDRGQRQRGADDEPILRRDAAFQTSRRISDKLDRRKTNNKRTYRRCATCRRSLRSEQRAQSRGESTRRLRTVHLLARRIDAEPNAVDRSRVKQNLRVVVDGRSVPT